MIYIQDDFGNRIPMLDGYGNLSVQALMLYTEDKLTEIDRKTISDFAANDEMVQDALEGFELASNPSKTRYHLGQLNREIQKKTGASTITALPRQQSDFDYKKLAAAIALLVVIGGATFFGTQYFGKKKLADNTQIETVSQKPPQAEALRLAGDKFMAEDEESSTDVVEAEVTSTADGRNVESESEEDALKQAEIGTNREDISNEKIVAETKDKKADISQNATAPKTIVTPESVGNDVNLANAEDVAEDIDLQTQSGAMYMSKAASEADNTRHENLKKEVKAANERADKVLAAIENQQSQSTKQKEFGRQVFAEQEATSNQSNDAKYPGGDIAMYKFIERKKIYTEAMKALDLNGAVTVSFDIEPDGRVANAIVKTGGNGLMNQDALRVVRSMPQWKAAKNANGETIRSSKSVIVKYGN